MLIKLKRCHPEAIVPTYATKNSAGADLYAILDTLVLPGYILQIRTGWQVEIPSGFCLKILPRSGVSLSHGNYIANAPGLIDPDYRGEILVLVKAPSNHSIIIQRGDRIAQCVLEAVEHMAFQEVQELAPSGRGARGFGSTGK